MSKWRIVYPLLPVLGLLVGITQGTPGPRHVTAARAASEAALPECASRKAAACPESSAEAMARRESISSMVYLPLINRPVTTPSQLVVPASADTTVIQGMPGKNFGHTNSIRAGYDDRQPAEAQQNEAILRGLVRFDLSGLPAGSRVMKATLRLYFFESYDYAGKFRTITAYRPTADWDEAGVTWESAPASAEAYGSQSIQHCACAGWYEFDVTPLVQAWVDSSRPNYGIMIRGPEESGSDSAWRGFVSRDYFPDSAYAPQLVVDYLSTIAPAESGAAVDTPETSGTALSSRQGPAPVVPGPFSESKSLWTAWPEP